MVHFLPISWNLSRLIENTGDVVHIKIFGQPLVILNSLKAARDLLDKRSSIYSDRPRFVLLAELWVASDFFRITAEIDFPVWGGNPHLLI